MGDYYLGERHRECNVSDLIGLSLVSVFYDKENEEIRFITDFGRVFVMYHDQDCCEHVSVDAIVGDLEDLIGTPIVLAEESSSEDIRFSKVDGKVGEYQTFDDSCTWTFYRFRTIKGDVDIRWYGSSSGAYSESVDFIELNKAEGK